MKRVQDKRKILPPDKVSGETINKLGRDSTKATIRLKFIQHPEMLHENRLDKNLRWKLIQLFTASNWAIISARFWFVRAAPGPRALLPSYSKHKNLLLFYYQQKIWVPVSREKCFLEN